MLELRERDGVSLADTQQQILAQLWQSRLGIAVDPVATSSAAEQIASLMGEREELWLPREVIAEKQLMGFLPVLLHSGVLIEKDGRIAFVHQTMFEHARARAFASTGESLSEHVHRRQDALFVRPTLWTSLEYLRSSDPAVYARELEALWSSQKTRTHVRRLLWDFLGQRTDPNEREVALITHGLITDASRPTAISAVTGNPGWFRELHRSLLPSLLSGTDAHMLVGLLAAAMQFARAEATELVETYWRDDSSKARLIATVLALAKNWSERMEALAVHVVSRGGVDDDLVNSLVYHAVQQRPDAAPRLIAAHLECKRAALGPIPAAEPGEDERARTVAKRDRLAPLKELVEHSAGLHSMIEAAQAAPASFLASVWPWFVGVVRELTKDTTTEVIRYRDDHCLGTSVGYRGIVRDLAAAIDIAIRRVGSSDSAAMFGFVETWQAEDSLAVHRFLMAGLRAALPASARFATTYLCMDERRLVVGDWSNDDLDTVGLVAELAPHIDSSGLRSIEDMVVRSRCVSEEQEPVKWRRSARDINRRHRLRLLRALGVDRLSSGSRALVEQEERRFPGPDEPRMAVTFTSRGAPISSEQMLVAKDSDILNLFRELPDSTDWDHPSDPMRGGSIQAARELATAAKRDPERFAALLHSFEPGVSERPVALVFGSLGETIPLSRLEDKLHALVAAGFFRGSYRHEAAWALSRAVRDGATMRPETCALLTSWLADSSEPDQPERPETSSDDPLLFGMHGGGILPKSTVVILEQVMPLA